MARIVTIALLLSLSVSLHAQARRIVLMEEATNASCAPCAANNPNLQAFFSTHFGSVISVRYHAWWPGTDPMYNLNTTDNANRINYYGINGVPNYLIDGVNYGVPGDPDGMTTTMNERAASLSPVWIDVAGNITADSVRATVKIIGLAPVAQTNLSLRVAVIERWIHYASPPGSNGERDFPDVMRKLLPDGNGTAVASITPGDTLSYAFSYPVNAAWNWQDLAVVAWLQTNTSKEVIQSNISYPTYSIGSPDARGQFLTTSQSVTKNYSIHNDNSSSIDVKIFPQVIRISSGWTYGLTFNGSPIDTIVATIQPGDSVAFAMNVTSGATPGAIKVRIHARNMNDFYNYSNSIDYFGVVKNGEVLFVDDDGGNAWEQNYYRAFDSAGVAYTSVGQADVAAIASQISPALFRAIFWNVSWGFPALIPSDISFLEGYLDQGGSLFIAGQDIGWDIFESGSGTPAAMNFYHTYLGANYLADASGGTSMTGIAGDPITDGISFSLVNPYSSYPEDIGVYSGASSVLILQYNNGKYGAIRKDNGTYKTVYLGIGLEQMSLASARDQIIRNTLSWFNVTTDATDWDQGLPMELALSQNYPNPFNPSTRISISLPRNGQVRLTIYDVLGKEIATLVDEVRNAGIYTLDFRAAGLSSGVYFYSLITENVTITKKMILMR